MTRSLPSSRVFAATLAIVLLVIIGVAYGVVRATSRPEPTPSHLATQPVSGRGSATLDVTSGMPVLSIRMAKLGGTLLRVATADDAPVRPVLDGTTTTVRLSLAADRAGAHAGYTVSVVLNSAVAWRLDLAGGTSRTVADLRGGTVNGIEVTAGSDVISVVLPEPTATTAVRVTGGASQLLMSVPHGVPVRVLAGGGAADVTLDAVSRTGVAGGTVITPPGWATAAHRYDVVATAGIAHLVVREMPRPEE
ncbi:MAG TPA: hypothetical protein VFB06_09760 [Streptosporangiaceae bacterium]|nr:hypothetical protein [Streptosporangiaceae bacterium]